MPSYLVETYLARGRAGERTAQERRARAAAAGLTQEDVPVGFERSIHVPEDELCFFVFDAPTESIAALVAQHAGLEAIRVVEADLSGRRSKAKE